MNLSNDTLASMMNAAYAAGYKKCLKIQGEAATDEAYNKGFDDGYARCSLERSDEAEADRIANICDEQGCDKPVSCRWGPFAARRGTCIEHSDWFKESKL